MNSAFQKLMNDATRLTRAGDLQAATAAIQAALGAKSAVRSEIRPAFDVIDVHAREVPAPQQPGVDPATPGDFVAGSSGSGTARRDYKLYIPPGAGESRLPLVVMLHGCTQDPDDFAKGTGMNDAALAQGFYVLYPAQSRRANAQRCWNWFKHSHQQRGRGEPAMLAAMTREVMAQHAIDPQRVYVAGLSAGGAMAAILGSAYPDLYAAVGVHSGLAAGAATDLPGALAAMRGGASAPTAARPWRANHRLSWRCRSDRAPGEWRAGHCCLYGHGVIRANPSGAQWQRARLHEAGPRRCGRWSRGRRALGGSRLAPRLVGRQLARLLHRQHWPGRHRRDAAILLRASAAAQAISFGRHRHIIGRRRPRRPAGSARYGASRP